VTSPISGISSALGIPALSGTSGLSGISAAGGTDATTGTSGSSFADVLASQVDQLSATQSTADSVSQQAAVGNVQDPSQLMIATTDATLATDTVVTLKNQAVSAFNEIMRMSV
jgi:flagellar hook-basal body complex protein FliE